MSFSKFVELGEWFIKSYPRYSWVSQTLGFSECVIIFALVSRESSSMELFFFSYSIIIVAFSLSILMIIVWAIFFFETALLAAVTELVRMSRAGEQKRNCFLFASVGSMWLGNLYPKEENCLGQVHRLELKFFLFRDVQDTPFFFSICFPFAVQWIKPHACVPYYLCIP